VSGKRSYQDPCGVARALDLVGERWALLVVRELLLGPKRFTDLRAGLPGASQNVLAQRLRDLEGTGLVRRRKLGPPAGTWVYELTERGRGLQPVLVALATWGSRQPMTSAGDLSADALILALRTTFDPAVAGPLRARYLLLLDDDRYLARVSGGRLEIARTAQDGAAIRPSEPPDATLTSSVGTLRAVVFGDLDLAEAQRRGALRTEGERAAVARFVGLFARPAPAE
jgi:DNA-binding HxlR family transcriptional regulator